jgi:hypothetical protein
VKALIAEGWALADGDLAAQARLLTAFNSAGTDPAAVELVEPLSRWPAASTTR